MPIYFICNFINSNHLITTFHYYMKIVFRQLFKLDLEFIKLAGATGLEPVWAEAGGFGDRCNRRYAKPLYSKAHLAVKKGIKLFI